MYELVRSSTLRHLLSSQVPAAGVSLVIAELFYKFHSFTLECLAFLGTWFVVDLVLRAPSLIRAGIRREPAP